MRGDKIIKFLECVRKYYGLLKIECIRVGNVEYKKNIFLKSFKRKVYINYINRLI